MSGSDLDLSQSADFLALFLTGNHDPKDLLKVASDAQLSLLVHLVSGVVFSRATANYQHTAIQALLGCPHPDKTWLEEQRALHLANNPERSRQILLSVAPALNHVVRSYADREGANSPLYRGSLTRPLQVVDRSVLSPLSISSSVPTSPTPSTSAAHVAQLGQKFLKRSRKAVAAASQSCSRAASDSETPTETSHELRRCRRVLCFDNYDDDPELVQRGDTYHRQFPLLSRQLATTDLGDEEPASLPGNQTAKEETEVSTENLQQQQQQQQESNDGAP